MTKNNYILTVDAKDLYLAELTGDKSIGYNIRNKKGDISTRKFINTLDFSLELIKLREVYERVYRRTNFSFLVGNKEYTNRIINVTFKYSVKEYNRIGKDIYLKYGYDRSELEFKDSVCFKNGELIGIQVEQNVENPIEDEYLGKYFWYENGVYNVKTNIKTIVSTSDLRHHFYEHGFTCDSIKYKRFKRSSGSSRVGKCLFIDEKLFKPMKKWSLCGIKEKNLKKGDLAAYEAYSSLTLSSIIDIWDIYPEQILVIDDYESVFKDKAAVTRIDNNNMLKTTIEDTEISNSIWDGMSLADKSLFGNKYKDKGMLLVRNRMFKSCVFNSNLQQFFKDHNITEISQLQGYTRATKIEDIKLITTPSSIKYLKFGTIEQFFDNLDPTFGIVKYEKPPQFFDGNMVQTHYQLINTLELTESEIEKLIAPSVHYLSLLKNEPSVLKNHIQYPENRSELNDTPLIRKSDIVFNLMSVNEDFCKTKLYRDFATDLITALRRNIKCGRIWVDGNYSTLCGNPIEMMFSAIGQFDGNSLIGKGNIYNNRFPKNMDLLCSRSPHVASGNILLVYNTTNDLIEKYMNPSNEIVYINAINENILQRLSGADYDSDTMLMTDNPILIAAAKRNYDAFPVPTSAVQGQKVQREFTNFQLAELDVVTSCNLIAEIINMAQELTTLMFDQINNGKTIEEVMPLYLDIAQLDVMSGIEIDKAKKEFVVDNANELLIMKTKYLRKDENNKTIKPNFFGTIARSKKLYDSNKNNYMPHKSSMDFLQNILGRTKVNYYKNLKTPVPFYSIFKEELYDQRKIKYPQIKRAIQIIENMQQLLKGISMSTHENTYKYEMRQEIIQDCAENFQKIIFGEATMIHLVKLIDNPSHKKYSKDLFNFLFAYANNEFFELINKSTGSIQRIIENNKNDYDFQIYSKFYKII